MSAPDLIQLPLSEWTRKRPRPGERVSLGVRGAARERGRKAYPARERKRTEKPFRESQINTQPEAHGWAEAGVPGMGNDYRVPCF